MEFFGKSVSGLFESFYEAHVAEHIRSFQVSFHEIPDDDASIPNHRFGYTLQDPHLPGKAEVHVRDSMPAADFEHCVAHELLHVVSVVVQFPVPGLNPRIPEDAPERGIVRDLLTIECVANDQLLVSLGFESGYIFSIRLQRLMQRIIETSDANDDLSRPWAVRTTIHYLRALLDSGPAALSEVRTKLDKLPSIRESGDQMYSEISRLDLQDRSQRLLALNLMRDTLRLKGMVDIVQPGERAIGSVGYKKSNAERRGELQRALTLIENSLKTAFETQEIAYMSVVAAQLRALLTTSQSNNPLLLDIAKEYNFPLDFYSVPLDYLDNEEVAQILGPTRIQWTGDSVRSNPEGPLIHQKVAIKEWLASTQVVVRGTKFTGEHLIRVVAEKEGGAHYDKVIPQELADMKSFSIGGVPSHYLTLARLGEIVVHLGKQLLAHVNHTEK